MNHFNLKPALFCASLFMLSLTTLSASPALTPVERHGALRVEGSRILNRKGEPAVLHGMSFFWSQWMGQYYTTNVVNWLRSDWACDVVRVAVGVAPDGMLGHPEREMARAKVVIQAAIDCGMYVVVDWHDHNAHENQAKAIAFFEEIARTYGKQPNIIYETWNEPLAKHDWATLIKPYHEAVVAKIRAIDPDNVIVLGTQTWSQDVDKASLNPVKGVNLAYTLHYYAATHKESLRQKARVALAKGVALFVTEWGTCEASGNGKLDEEECRLWFAFMEKNNLSWCNWSVADKVETSAALRPKASALGGWSPEDLSPSGQFVRAELRKARR